MNQLLKVNKTCSCKTFYDFWDISSPKENSKGYNGIGSSGKDHWFTCYKCASTMLFIEGGLEGFKDYLIKRKSRGVK